MVFVLVGVSGKSAMRVSLAKKNEGLGVVVFMQAYQIQALVGLVELTA